MKKKQIEALIAALKRTRTCTTCQMCSRECDTCGVTWERERILDEIETKED